MKAPGSEPPETGSSAEIGSKIRGYAVAVAAAVGAFLIRYALDGYAKDKYPLAAVIIAVTLVSWYGGFVPSIVTATIGFLLCNWFFIPPRYQFSLSIHDPNHIGIVVSFTFIASSIILFGRSMHAARRRADANAQTAINHLAQLQTEMLERQRAEAQVRQLNVELEHRVEQRTAELVAVNQELESFTYSVSHDLRAPLRHVDGYAQLLEEEYGGEMPPEARKFTQKIRQGSRNMGRLVDDLLNLSRIGKRELSRERVDLNALVAEVVAEVTPEAANRRIEWDIGKLPVVECDSGLVRQVLINVLSNAVKYTRPREPARVQVGETRLNGETAIYVRDNGVGFDMKYANKLFGVFQRLHRAEEFEGNGVGLATVARIVRKHGGRVWAEAEVNQGATFYFTLGPAGRKAPAQEERPAAEMRPFEAGLPAHAQGEVQTSMKTG